MWVRQRNNALLENCEDWLRTGRSYPQSVGANDSENRKEKNRSITFNIVCQYYVETVILWWWRCTPYWIPSNTPASDYVPVFSILVWILMTWTKERPEEPSGQVEHSVPLPKTPLHKLLRDNKKSFTSLCSSESMYGPDIWKFTIFIPEKKHCTNSHECTVHYENKSSVHWPS